jgi:hypothetical protein
MKTIFCPKYGPPEVQTNIITYRLMKHKFYLMVSLVFIITSANSQNIRYRNATDVLYEIYTPSDESTGNLRISDSLLHKDIDLFVRTIEEIGVNPYVNLPKDSFYEKINLLKSKIKQPLTRREFLLQFIPTVKELGLSHTHVYSLFTIRSYDKRGGKYLPLGVRIEKFGLFVNENYSSVNIPINDEIIAINNIPSKRLLDSLYRYADGATEYSKLMDIQENFSKLLWLVYDFSDTIQITTKQTTYKVNGLPSSEINKNKNEKLNQQQKKDSKLFEYCQIDSTTGKLTLREFMIRDEAKYYRFLDSVFCQVNKKLIKNLIIDVRDNPGGGDDYGIEVIKYLYNQPFKAYSKFYYKKSKILENFSYMFLYPEDRNNAEMQKAANCNGACESEHEYGTYYECENKTYNPKADSIRFNGKVYVLSNYLVYSAGNTFVGLVKDYKIGKIIGTETGQSPSSDGQLCWFLLPHSNLLASGSTTLAIRPGGDPGTTRGVLPDYEVSQLAIDAENGVDTIMDFTINLIKNKN